MKIIDSLISQRTLSNTPTHLAHQGFDEFLSLSSKKTQGGDYYLQHQNQLEHSEITFKALKQDEHHTHFLLKGLDLPFKNNKPSHDENQHFLNPSKLILKTQPNPTPSIILSKKEFSNLNRLIEKKMVSFIDATGEKIKRNLSTKSSPNESKRITDQPSIEFKNHLIFINQNTVELSLSTSGLTKTQADELKQLIKKWLTEKGLLIKRWIINGEQI